MDKSISLIFHIEKLTEEAKNKDLLSIEIPNISKEDFLGINEWLFKKYLSISMIYNESTNISLTLGL